MNKKHAILLVGHDESDKPITLNILIDNLKRIAPIHTYIDSKKSSVLFSFMDKKIGIFPYTKWVTSHNKCFEEFTCYHFEMDLVCSCDIIVFPSLYKGEDKNYTEKALNKSGYAIHEVKRNSIDFDKLSTPLHQIQYNNFDEYNIVNQIYHDADAKYLEELIKFLTKKVI